MAASITHMDDGVGRIVVALRNSDQRENTLIVFASDNGGQKSWTAPATQYKGRYEPHTTLGNNRPLRGWKGDLYEGGIRVPAFVNWPGRIPAGQTLQSPVSILDWMPTFFSIAGHRLAPDARLEGKNIWPLLMGQAKPEPRTLYWRSPGRLAIRQGDWKLLTDRRFQRAELYNLADDPNEEKDLAQLNPDRVIDLTKALKKQVARDPGKRSSKQTHVSHGAMPAKL